MTIHIIDSEKRFLEKNIDKIVENSNLITSAFAMSSVEYREYFPSLFAKVECCRFYGDLLPQNIKNEKLFAADVYRLIDARIVPDNRIIIVAKVLDESGKVHLSSFIFGTISILYEGQSKDIVDVAFYRSAMKTDPSFLLQYGKQGLEDLKKYLIEE